MESTGMNSQKEFDLQELNAQMLKIDSILKSLQFKIPSINQSLSLTDKVDDFLNYNDKFSGEKDRSNFYIKKDGEHFYLSPADWQQLEVFLTRSSIADLSFGNMNFKKNELEPSFSQDLWQCWQQIIKTIIPLLLPFGNAKPKF